MRSACFRHAAFYFDKKRVLDEHDPEKQLSNGFQIPQVNGDDVEPLRKYLLDVAVLVHDYQTKSKSLQTGGTTYPFRLDEIRISLYTRLLSCAIEELRMLLSLGVPVMIHTINLDPVSWRGD